MTAGAGVGETDRAETLKYLVYSSVASRPMDPADLEAILYTARRRNRAATSAARIGPSVLSRCSVS